MHYYIIMMNLEALRGFMQTRCSDGSCCCISKRTSVIAVSLICLVYSYIDKKLWSENEPCCTLQIKVRSMRRLIYTLFEVANIISLLGAVIESQTLLKLYLWYMLAFIIMALVIAILEFVTRLILEDSLTFMTFISEVTLFFVMFRCLPMVDSFRRSLEE